MFLPSVLLLGSFCIGASAKMSTVAGAGGPWSDGTDSPASIANFNFPRSVWQDSLLTTYVVESSSHCVRKYTTNNIVQTFLGQCDNGGVSSGDGGPAISAQLNTPIAMWVTSNGVAYVSEVYGNKIRSVSASGICGTFAGQGGAFASGDSGQATSANIYNPQGIFVNTNGVMYITAFTEAHIRMIATTGIITSVVGTGTSSFSGDSGPASSATINGPQRVYQDTMGSLYIGDGNNNRVRVVRPNNNQISTFIGNGVGTFTGNGVAGTATGIDLPTDMRIASDTGDFFVSGYVSGRIFQLSHSTRLVSTFAGTGTPGFGGDNGALTSASLNCPDGLYRDSAGNMYIGDANNYRIRLAAPDSTVTTSAPTAGPTQLPTQKPTTTAPTLLPTTTAPTLLPTTTAPTTAAPSAAPTTSRPTLAPTDSPTPSPTLTPTASPSREPTISPTQSPTVVPTLTPTLTPTTSPTLSPTQAPTIKPTNSPTASPTTSPTQGPTTMAPTQVPSVVPTIAPTAVPTVTPSIAPTAAPSITTAPITASPTYKVTNALAFAAITSDQSVVCWGAAASGGDCSSVQSQFEGVSAVVSSKNAFTALMSGRIVAWGNAAEISGWTDYSEYSTVESVVATEQAFAGLTSGGAVFAYGADCCGGDVDEYGWSSHLSSGVRSVHASSGAFAALKWDGSVYTWGNKFAGGGVSSATREDLASLTLLTASRSAFAGMTAGGSVVAWGRSDAGGSVTSAVLSGTTEYLLSGPSAFVSVTQGEGLTAWGSSANGGDSSSVTASLSSGVMYVAHTSSAFCALKSDGTLVVWGNSALGGDASGVTGSFASVVGNADAFAAVGVSGGVRVWGKHSSGGFLPANTTAVLATATTVYHTKRAFAAITSGGSVVAWGASNFGGSTSAVASQLTSGVRLICANDVAFTAIKTDGTAVAWGYSRSVDEGGVLAGTFTTVLSC